MKVLTFRLGQFAISALLLTVLFRYALSVCIGMGSWTGSVLCSVVYFCLMFLAGWHFGEKEIEDIRIHDIGLRYHLVTFLLCVSVGYAAYYVGWETETLKSMTIGALCWGIGLFVHLVFFLLEYNKTIKGYAKSDIFD